MNLTESFIKDYAGHPVRVALNMFLVAAMGILIGHYLLGVGLTPRLVFASMLPPLGAIFLAGQLKIQRRGRR